MDQNNQTQCVNCQTVTTSDGKTVWVCENCGEVNKPETVESFPDQNPVTENVSAPAEPAPVVDVTTAQAELDQAASQLGTPAAVPSDTQVVEKTTGSSI